MKTDFLPQCLSETSSAARQNIPIDVFCKEFCRVCQNSECSRSGMNNGLFQIRARNWYNDLFLNPQQANESDSQYDKIREKWRPVHAVFNDPPKVVAASQVEQTEIPEPTITQEVMELIPEPENIIEPKAQPDVARIEELKIPKPHEERPLVARPTGATNIAKPTNTPFNSPLYVSTQEKEVVISSGDSFTFDD